VEIKPGEKIVREEGFLVPPVTPPHGHGNLWKIRLDLLVAQQALYHVLFVRLGIKRKPASVTNLRLIQLNHHISPRQNGFRDFPPLSKPSPPRLNYAKRASVFPGEATTLPWSSRSLAIDRDYPVFE
jgi:hypothetical protein